MEFNQVSWHKAEEQNPLPSFEEVNLLVGGNMLFTVSLSLSLVVRVMNSGLLKNNLTITCMLVCVGVGVGVCVVAGRYRCSRESQMQHFIDFF